MVINHLLTGMILQVGWFTAKKDSVLDELHPPIDRGSWMFGTQGLEPTNARLSKGKSNLPDLEFLAIF